MTEEKVQFKKVNILIPDDGTWEEWIEYSKVYKLDESGFGKEAGARMIRGLKQAMDSNNLWKIRKEEYESGSRKESV